MGNPLTMTAELVTTEAGYKGAKRYLNALSLSK